MCSAVLLDQVGVQSGKCCQVATDMGSVPHGFMGTLLLSQARVLLLISRCWNGWRVIFITDAFSKDTVVVPTWDCQAVSGHDLQVCCSWSHPSHQDQNFESSLIQQLFRLRQVDKSLMARYHPVCVRLFTAAGRWKV